ncbi:MAG TPA: 4-(cytidine 5'-diphospho)-2-C-methyl-D-erythritol kinase [Candidatus Binataceae bacterium]|jgi:4-diphosphocytidyl-2-C-methyl-D-erythritol kinase|nr:4-(cytidine 5'-diphospho)-2-C-methyl-D-erythritol kinase [Candidatus Binataceae bacterium]
MVKLISAFAPAKLNLYLRVVGRRADGYHELDSIFVPITIGDRIAIETRPSDRAVVNLCGIFGNLPADERNLAVRAAVEFMREFAVTAEVLIDLRKSIPSGAGLGGGSSDAATVLRMMATLFRLDEPERLARVAVSIGADVPFFLNPIPARVTGIGERIAPLDAMPQFALVVAVPPIEVPTVAVFRDLKPQDWSGPASDADVLAIAAGESSPRLFVNDLARAAMTRWPEIARVKARLEELGARAASMTGSGAGVFGIFASSEAAARAAAELRERDPALTAIATTIYHA